ncbi:MAG: hypothetical protein LBH43_05510 [Treponema sp.]|jgi:hypothetical protein|nr:hypothetical protein [Treponema sp.]
MNQDQVKEKLLSVEDAPLDFTLIFSGKKSKKVNGLYKPDSREIILHNRNFAEAGKEGDNLLLYTAIHEYAHHLHACSKGGKLPARAHSAEFWAILHTLLEKAEKQGLYRNVFESSRELTELTELIQKKYLKENGSLVKELGKLLLKAYDLCAAAGGRWEEYVDRVLRIPRSAANLAIRIHQYDLKPESGADNMRFLAGIKNEEKRAAAQNALLNEGKSPDMVKTAVRKKEPQDEGLRQRLEKEKLRLERTIASLSKRLAEVEKELDSSAK